MLNETATDRETRRWLRRLAIIGDSTRPRRVRIAAIRSVQSRLPDTNPFKAQRPEALLAAVKWPWETKYTRLGEVMVSRPAQDLLDLWET